MRAGAGAVLTGSQLALAIAAVLLGAVALGVLLHWLWIRPGRGRRGEGAVLAKLMDDLHEAEAKRDAAELALREAEEHLARREAELEREIAELRSDLDTMHGGLIHARQRVLELEAELERLQNGV